MKDIRGVDIDEGDTIAMAGTFGSNVSCLLLARVGAVTPFGVYVVAFQKGRTSIPGIDMAVAITRPVVVVCKASKNVVVEVKGGLDPYDDPTPLAVNN